MACFDDNADIEPRTKKSKIQPDEEDSNIGLKTDVVDARAMCKFGERCFKRSLQHKADFQHPKSTTLTKDDNQGPTECRDGITCQETDLLHYAEFTHPVQEHIISEGTKETNECEDIMISTLACEGTQPMDEESDEDVDGTDSTSTLSCLSRDNTVLNRGPSIVKCYSMLTEEERKELLHRAFELKEMLRKELYETQKIIEKKNKALKKIHNQLEKVSKIDGESDALEKDQLVYFPLFAEREYKEGSAAQIHYRLAESQFYRLVDVKDNYRITKVEYLVNPVLIKRFKRAQQLLKESRGEDHSYPVLAFHGTKEENISSIAQTGFRLPGDSNFEHATDTGWYGCGVYFSEYPSYSMKYIKGSSKLLLCQVLPGKVYRCTNLIHGEQLQTGNDSHTSPDGKELVIFNSHHILPSYIVHYGEAKGDYSY